MSLLVVWNLVSLLLQLSQFSDYPSLRYFTNMNAISNLSVLWRFLAISSFFLEFNKIIYVQASIFLNLIFPVSLNPTNQITLLLENRKQKLQQACALNLLFTFFTYNIYRYQATFFHLQRRLPRNVCLHSYCYLNMRQFSNIGNS